MSVTIVSVLLIGLLAVLSAIAFSPSSQAAQVPPANNFNPSPTLAPPLPPPPPPHVPVNVRIGYKVIGGGSNYVPPILKYFYFGKVLTWTMSTTPTEYTMESDTVWNVTAALGGSTPSEIWQTSMQTWGTATEGSGTNFSYYHQYLVTFQYSVVGSSAGFNPPIVSYTAFGVAQAQTAVWVGWADAGTTVSYPQTDLVFASGRWAAGTFSGSVNASREFMTIYFHQYSATISYSISGGGTLLPPSFRFVTFGRASLIPLTGTPTQIWIDEGAAYSSTNPIASSDLGERWLAGSSSSGIMTSSVVLPITYYHQYSITASYKIVGGTSPTTISLTGISANQPVTYGLTSTPQGFWLDAGTSYNAPQLIEPTFGERWTSLTPNSAVVLAPAAFQTTYYHQYSLVVGYNIVGGGSPTAPTLLYKAFGSPVSVLLHGNVLSSWADNGTSITITNPLQGSTTTERWSTNVAVPLITTPLNVQVPYYHQFSVSFNYTEVDRAGGPTPSVSFSSSGVSVVKQLSVQSTAFWLDSNSAWTAASPLGTTSQQERWVPSGPSNGIVSKSSSFSVPYQHQYLVTFVADPVQGGKTDPNSWVDAGSSAQLSVFTNQGWKFVGWNGTGQGSFTGPDSNVSRAVSGPYTERARFYASVFLSPSSSGSLSYAIGSQTGKLDGKTLQTYVPVGTLVTVSASSSSPLITFDGWKGGDYGTASPLTVTVQGPVGIYASYSINYTLRAVIVGLVVTIIIAVVLLIVLRRRLPLGNPVRKLTGLLPRKAFAPAH
ncbi:MAG: hypothetical protein OK422_00335 [Thaumarchaeota archaeon]|nr:hypothetical protein [Nitrososphaerota archaeon]